MPRRGARVIRRRKSLGFLSGRLLGLDRRYEPEYRDGQLTIGTARQLGPARSGRPCEPRSCTGWSHQTPCSVRVGRGCGARRPASRGLSPLERLATASGQLAGGRAHRAILFERVEDTSDPCWANNDPISPLTALTGRTIANRGPIRSRQPWSSVPHRPTSTKREPHQEILRERTSSEGGGHHEHGQQGVDRSVYSGRPFRRGSPRAPALASSDRMSRQPGSAGLLLARSERRLHPSRDDGCEWRAALGPPHPLTPQR
jgi:hypothetical protein